MKIGQKIWHWNGISIQRIEVENIHQVVSKEGIRIEKVNDKRIDLNMCFKTKKELKEYLIVLAENQSESRINELKSL